MVPEQYFQQSEDSALDWLEAVRVQYSLPALAALSLDTKTSTNVTGRRNAYVANSPITPNDVFKLGSNTKAITSTLLARLIEESTYPRKLTWDTTIPVALLFSGVIIHPGHYRTTLAQIAAHRSGIVDGEYGRPPAFSRLYDPRLTPQEGRRLTIEAALKEPPATTPGSAFSYSNTGYMLLGFIMEALLKQPYEDLLQQKVFDPLEMKTCGFGVSPPLKSRTGVENPWPHVPSPLGPIPIYPDARADVPLAMAPAGSVYCSMTDYAKFLQLHIDGFHGRRNPVLRFSNGFAKLHERWPGQNYTCGAWNRLDVEVGDGTTPRLGHEGSNTLNYATAWVYPEIQRAVAGFTNMGEIGAEVACDTVVRTLSKDIVG